MTAKKYFNATALIPTDLLGRRTKKVRHFLDNKRLKLPANMPRPIPGKGGYTQLPMSLLPEYLLWLTPRTRKAILAGVPPEEIMRNIKEYWDES